MEVSILKDFLLFESTTWIKYADTILSVCSKSLIPVFIFTLLFDKISNRPQPIYVLKKLLIAQFVLFLIPIYFKPVATFGFTVGDSLLKQQQNGLIANWKMLKRKAEVVKVKKGKSIGSTTILTVMFLLDGLDIVEKGAGLLIFVCMLLIKVIYSITYYSAYSISGIMCVLYIFPQSESHLSSILKTLLYLIITAILVALVLSFMNDHITITVGKSGFIDTMSGLAKFLVLCFVLLGSLAIGFFIVNGKGPESWSGRMGTLLGAGLAHQVMGQSSSVAKALGTKGLTLGASALSAGTSSIAPALAGMGAMATSPFKAGANNISGAIKTSLSNKVSNIESLPKTGSYTLDSNPLNNNTSQIERSPLVEGRYQRELDKILPTDNTSATRAIASTLNPVNHLKASANATRGLAQEVGYRTKESLGIPLNSSNMSVKQKLTFAANKVVNGSSNLSNNELLKNQIIANNISKHIGNK